MSKNTNLSFLTDYITADITNGRIGINNASPTVAFDVVGATKITGVLTLTSTISNGTYAYTLPSATGTLALTSDLSGYLPLTGGTLTGALIGTSATFSGLLTVNGFGNSTFSSGGTGYNKLTIRNTTAGTGNGAQLSIGTNADADQFYVQSFATTFTTSGMNIAGGAVINGEGPGGLSIAATQSNIGFYTNGAGAANLRMTITSTGNVGIGTTTSAWGSPTTGKVIQIGNRASVFSYNNSTTDIANNLYFNGSDYIYIESAFSTMYRQGSSDGTHTWFTAASGTAGASVPLTERMRITSGGNLLVGTTSAGTDFSRMACATASQNVFGLISTDDSSGAGFLVLRNSATTFIGGIARVGTTNAVAFNTSSDYRLKEDLKEIKGLEKVCAIKVYDFKWKDNIARMDGVLAHELQEVLPYAVTGIKDGEDMQGVDYSKLTPILIKAIQELKAEIETLKNK